MPRVLLVLPTSTYRAGAFLNAVDAMGIDCVIASDQAPTLAGLMTGRVLALDLDSPQRAAATAVGFAREWPVDGVVGVDEASVVTAAHIAAALGVVHNPAAAVAATRDKRLLRALLAGGGVPQPGWVEVRGDPAGTAAVAAARAVGLPAVVKPVDMAASRGVIRADTVGELATAIGRVDALLRRPDLCGPEGDPPLLVERFTEGAEIAVEGLLRGGALTVIAVFDKPDPLDGPFFTETLYVTPSRHPAQTLAQAIAVTSAAVAAIGLVEGPIHAELRLRPAGPVLIEVAARSIGGRCSSALLIRDGDTEMTLEELILRHACGLPLGEPRLAPGAAGVLMLPVPESGVLRGVSGTAEATAVPGVTGVELTIPVGQAVEALPEGDRYLGFVVARGEHPAAVESTLRSAWALIHTDMESIRPATPTSSPAE
ncbi:MAG TPA: ATP-grasp domain-containing protein [Candidatus Dormibacteraeota bacterium]|nr:ATP-grasp domain-containing protein [Candidatus Dormibacteraeota bacterium]